MTSVPSKSSDASWFLVKRGGAIPFPDAAASAFGTRRSATTQKPVRNRVEFDSTAAVAFGHASGSQRSAGGRVEFDSTAAVAFGHASGSQRSAGGRVEFDSTAASAFGKQEKQESPRSEGDGRYGFKNDAAVSAFGNSKRSGGGGGRRRYDEQSNVPRPAPPVRHNTIAAAVCAALGDEPERKWAGSALQRGPVPAAPATPQSTEEAFPTLGGPVSKPSAATAGAGSKPSFAELMRKRAEDEEQEERRRKAEEEQRLYEMRMHQNETQLFRRLNASRVHQKKEENYYDDEEEESHPDDLDNLAMYESSSSNFKSKIHYDEEEPAYEKEEEEPEEEI